jgi:hypothetical protein
MTTPSSFEGTGLSIGVFTPLVQGGTNIGNYTSDVNSYSHTISANGGYVSSDIEISGSNLFAEDWLQYGLGRHICVYGPGLNIVWEGFVNQIDINMGSTSFTRGPITNLGNFVWGVYSPIAVVDLIDCLPVLSTDGELIIYDAQPMTAVEDEYSISKYGLWEKLVNIGEATPCDAERIRDIYLSENAYPEGNPSLSLSDNEGGISVKLSCRGYIDWLSYIYNYVDDHLSIYLSTIIKNVLADSPNDIISTSYDKIDENLYIKDPYTSDNKSAKAVIDEIVSLGGGTDERWTFGVYRGRKVIYTAVPTEVEYIYYRTGKTQMVETIAGETISPWDVVPCKWVAIPTYLYSYNYELYDIRNDPRVFFAEEVTFTAPDQVSISGAKISRLAQYLTKLGLGGA